MKSTGKVLLAPFVTIFLVITLFYLVIKIHPYIAGDPFFNYQNAVENGRVKLMLSPEKRVEAYFVLIERRLEDLASLDRIEYVRPTIEAFDQAVSKAIQSIQLLDWDNAVIYYHNVQPLMRRVEIVIEDLSDRMYHQDLAILQHKAEYLKTAKTSTEIIKIGATQYSSFHVSEPESPEIMVKEELVDVKPVKTSFESQKNFNCMNCHQDGLYMDPESRCSNCHLRETYFMMKLGTAGYRPEKFEEKYPFHFVGDCINCHSTKSWVMETFEHPYAYSCIICHENNIPELDQKPLDQVFLTGSGRKINTKDTSHYPMDCIQCHTNTSSWGDYSYDHQQDTCSGCHDKDERFIRYNLNGIRCLKEQNCQNCHTYEGHNATYGETCYECHQNVKNWLDVSINHDQFTTCRSCHDSDKPDTHQYKSDCNVCHSTVDWKKLLFDHSSTSNCISCHTAPGDHLSKEYTDQCSTCHSIYLWEKALFHQVMSNCTNCHTSPENHYPALCTSCHDTDNWKNISVNHTALSACTNCHSVPVNHYPAACTSCHNTTSWLIISVNHTDLTTCTSCHIAPTNHYPGNCQTCHNTNSWEPQNYHNDSTTACGNCHTAPAIHYPLACEVCHKTTTSWNAVYDHSVTSLACSTCHLRPADHWTGECSNCHVTSSWDQVDFDHSGYTDCKSCHTSPQGHPGAQCSRCHTTDTWEVP